MRKIENKVLKSRPTTNYINNIKSEWVKHLDNRQRLSDGIKTKIQLSSAGYAIKNQRDKQFERERMEKIY